MRIRFETTSADGPVTLGFVTFPPLKADTVIARRILDNMLRDIDRKDEAAVRKAIEGAPQRYDGAYLRAEIMED